MGTSEHFYDRPCSVLKIHCLKSPLINYKLHFTDGETEAQRGDDLRPEIGKARIQSQVCHQNLFFPSNTMLSSTMTYY